jgi:hypothetical protein
MLRIHRARGSARRSAGFARDHQRRVVVEFRTAMFGCSEPDERHVGSFFSRHWTASSTWISRAITSWPRATTIRAASARRCLRSLAISTRRRSSSRQFRCASTSKFRSVRNRHKIATTGLDRRVGWNRFALTLGGHCFPALALGRGVRLFCDPERVRSRVYELSWGGARSVERPSSCQLVTCVAGRKPAGISSRRVDRRCAGRG